MRKSKSTSPEPVKLNGHHRPGFEEPAIPVTAQPAPACKTEFVELRSKRKAVAQVRVTAIDAIWEDAGALDGPYFVQAGGRTFHPAEDSFQAVRDALGLM